MSKIQGFILYRIWYGDVLVYLGRTKQPLQSRIHGHLFKKPMHRSISINLVTKIEYAEFRTEADMNLYEIYRNILVTECVKKKIQLLPFEHERNAKYYDFLKKEMGKMQNKISISSHLQIIRYH